MTRLIWDALEDRSYESGVDKGIVQIPDGPLLPWNGLVAIDESESQGTEVKGFLDGVPYANLKFGGFYQATVKAYGFPVEASEIIGIREVLLGFSLTSQARVEFNLAYRSMINDVDYKLHFIHRAIASPSSSGSETLSDDPDPEIFDWVITAVPSISGDHKPTSHIVVDTITSDPEIIFTLETLLYGDDADSPEFPTQEELIAIFA